MTKNINPFPMIEILRNNQIESFHYGSGVVVGPGNVSIIEWGDVDKQIFPRSALKIVQAIPLVESGAASSFELGAKHLAIASSSHQGSLIHTNIIKNWLNRLGLSERHLKCGVQPPSDRFERQKLKDCGKKPSEIHNNCSGKHLGFLTTIKHENLNFDYNDVDHPLQKKIKMILEELSNETITNYGIDGCSAPNFMCSLRGLAFAMHSLTDKKTLGISRSKSVEAILLGMLSNPLLVAGSGRACSELMSAVDSPTIVKTGAEGVFVAVIPEKHIGIAIKILDGATRAAEAAITLILIRLGVLNRDHPVVNKRLFCGIRNWSGKLTGYVNPSQSFWDSGKKLI